MKKKPKMKRVILIMTSGIALVISVLIVPAMEPGESKADLKSFQHLFVIMMENTNYENLIGNPNAPWINTAAKTYGLATRYYGISHPSQPNYIAATTGATNGVTHNRNVTINVRNLIDQLEDAGKTWKDYQQSFSLCGGNKLAKECGNQLYERKHNPFVSFSNVQTNPARMANIVDLSELDADLASGNLPDFSWISPDQCNDMHGRLSDSKTDPCSFDNRQQVISAGDLFLKSWVAKIIGSKAWTGNSVIFITWDEGDTSAGCCNADPGGGHVVMLALSRSNPTSRRSDVAYNHYSLLATIQEGWDLGCLANTCSGNVLKMSDLLGPPH
jgi:phospholipase C